MECINNNIGTRSEVSHAWHLQKTQPFGLSLCQTLCCHFALWAPDVTLASGLQRQQNPGCCTRCAAHSSLHGLLSSSLLSHSSACSFLHSSLLNTLRFCSRSSTYVIALEKRLYLDIHCQYVIWHLWAAGTASKSKKPRHLQQLLVSESILPAKQRNLSWLRRKEEAKPCCGAQGSALHTDTEAAIWGQTVRPSCREA